MYPNRIYFFGDHHLSCYHPHRLLLPQTEQNEGKILYFFQKIQTIQCTEWLPNLQEMSMSMTSMVCL